MTDFLEFGLVGSAVNPIVIGDVSVADDTSRAAASETSNERGKARKPSPRVHQPKSKKVCFSSEETESVFLLHGSTQHIITYSKLIESAKESVIVASWKLSWIPEDIFDSLMAAKHKGIYISFLVNELKSDKILAYFDDAYDSDDDPSFAYALTKTHSKFLLVDSKTLVVGSFNALAFSQDEGSDTSLCISGTVRQIWPYYMRIRDTYTDLNEDQTRGIFSGIAMISRARYGSRDSLKRELSCGSSLSMFWTTKAHEDFYRAIIPLANKITVYSPFCTKGNATKRMLLLKELLSPEATVKLKVQPANQQNLRLILNEFPQFRNQVDIQPFTGHQKIFAVNDDILCIGSLNWLSASQSETDSYGNTEISILLYGPIAKPMIAKLCPDHCTLKS